MTRKQKPIKDFLGALEQADKQTRRNGAPGVFGHARRGNTTVDPETIRTLDQGIKDHVRHLEEKVGPSMIGAISDVALADSTKRKKCLKNNEFLSTLDKIEQTIDRIWKRQTEFSGLEPLGVLGFDPPNSGGSNSDYQEGKFAGGKFNPTIGGILRLLITRIRLSLNRDEDVNQLARHLDFLTKKGFGKDGKNMIEYFQLSSVWHNELEKAKKTGGMK